MIKKKKILLLTSIYVGNDIPNTFTPVVHYFAREWVKMGNEVLVVHNQAYYPRAMYLISSLFEMTISSITGTTVPVKRNIADREYFIDNVPVYRFPMFKLIPHRKFSSSVIKSQTNKILRLLEDKRFIPDIIIGHWANPQLELVNKLKDNIGCRSCIVMHDSGKNIKSIHRNNYKQLISNIDVWGYRSHPIQIEFEQNYGERKNSFLCFSGIPQEFIMENNPRLFKKDLNTFLFVGTLIKRKYPASIINAINQVYKHGLFKINYIGSGGEQSAIKKLIKSKKLENSVYLLGKLPRIDIQEIMAKSDCFIMISKDEAFGLVYLEAMGAGCITIASRDEGFDGIIEHGVNGFLCEAGNENELAILIRHINSLSSHEKNRISTNAINTAKQLTNKKVAKYYIENALS